MNVSPTATAHDNDDTRCTAAGGFFEVGTVSTRLRLRCEAVRCGARRLVASSVECIEMTRLDGDEDAVAMRRDSTVQVCGVCVT